MTLAEPVDNERLWPEFGRQEVQAGFVDDRHDFAEEHVNLAARLIDNGVQTQGPRQTERQGHQQGADEEGGHRGDDKAGSGADAEREIGGVHCFSSRMTDWAWL